MSHYPMTKLQKIAASLSAIVLFLTIACGPRRSANEKRYPLKGKVVAVDKSEHTATIKHQDIPGYMPGMTMPFKLKNDADLEMLKPGDDVTATLVVTDVDSWIEVTAIVEGGSPLTPTAVVPGEPKPGDEIPDFGLINQDGKRVRLSQYKGAAVALTFVYTRCPQPDQCTLMSTNFAAIDKALQAQPDVYQKTDRKSTRLNSF